MDIYSIIKPKTKDEFISYYYFRWSLLREPWGQPIGSERSLDEKDCIHRMIVDDKRDIVAVGRLQFNDSSVAQIRYMAVDPKVQKIGLGKKMIFELEKIAKDNHYTKIILESRETAVEFYEKCGYRVVKKSYLLFGEIQHYLMQKSI